MAEHIRHWLVAARPAAGALWRLAGAALLAYVFILILITASLQTSVAARLAAMDLPDGRSTPLNYSSGYALWRADEDNRQALATLRGEQRRLIDKIEAAKDAFTRADYAWQSTMEVHELMLRRLASARGCEFLGERARSALTTELVLSDLRACLDQGTSLSEAQREAAQELLREAPAFRKSAAEYIDRENEVAALERRLERVAGAITVRSRNEPVRAEVSGTFSELAAFAGDRMVGGGLFGGFPPAVIHILLAFVSGMFGALLITLVLVVYPKTELRLSSGEGRYEARIFLGGLISICVFVVLGGGTAVLGTTEGFGSGEANFLAFCAIGILAGMFSDRVAHWLSSRADAFFKGRGEDESRAVRATPAGGVADEEGDGVNGEAGGALPDPVGEGTAPPPGQPGG
ncbi:MAG TPA: hypothetical protein VEB68_03085 [Croceibacterium sp.]|nr:hypothetical protein [Croceibacterium sp.]